MNKALTPENERRILRRMKSIFFLNQWNDDTLSSVHVLLR